MEQSASAHDGVRSPWPPSPATPPALQALYEEGTDGLFILAPDGRILDANPAARAMVGMTTEELRSLTADQVQDILPAAATPTTYLTPQGSKATCVVARAAPGGYRHLEGELERLSRMQLLVAEANRAIVRATTPQEMFEATCRGAISTRTLRMAWVGMVDAATNLILPVASAGFERGYLDSVRISVADVPEGRGPTGTAVREARPVYCNDISSDPAMAPWREHALQRGYRASGAFPLFQDGRAVGALSAYAVEQDYFSGDILTALETLTGDLSLALDLFRHRAQQAEVEAALRTSEERFRSSLEALVDGFTVLSAIRNAQERIVDFRIDYINDAACRMNHVSRERTLGRSVLEFSEFSPETGPAGLIDAYARVVETGEPFVNEGLEFSVNLDGYRLAGFFDLRAVRVGDGCAITFRDVTDRQRSQQALTESEERFRATFNQTAVGLIHVRLDGTFILANAKACEITGYPEEDLLRLGFRDISLPEDPLGDAATLGRLARGELASHAAEKPVLRNDGSVTWVQLTASAVRDPVGSARYFTVALEDISDRLASHREIQRLNESLERQVEERTTHLEQANRDLESFAYSVAHDLRTPLRAMSGFSEALLEEYRDQLDETGQDYAERILAASQRMGTLIDDLLALSRLARVQIRPETVDLSTEAGAICARLRSGSPGRRVRVDIQPGINVRADRILVRTALERLLENAWKFTSGTPNAIIELTAAPVQNGWVRCSVTDNGVGFDPAYAAKLFQPFERLHRATEFAGTGIGLASVRRIVERHGGQVWADGGLGRGATFSFSLPAAGESQE